jgi:ABC-type transport system substrate-binding protein
MKKLVVLAALAFALGTVQQASACDFGAHAANATPVVVASTNEPTTQQPAAKPEAATPVKSDDLCTGPNCAN